MSETTELPPLSVATETSVAGLVRAKHEVKAWTHNLQQALADDLAATPPRLTPEQAAEIAKANEVEAPPKPGSAAEAQETTAEANQAQLDAQTKTAEEAAARDQKAAAEAHKADEKAKPKDDDDEKSPAKAKDEKPPAATHTSR
jgi:hypothetical protein